MPPNSSSSLVSMQRLSATALMAALITAGALFHLMIGPVPVTFQDFFVIIAGLLLGPRQGALSVALYILAGTLGLPVFSGGRGGIGHVLGPTGGYLAGFVFLAFCSGLGRNIARRAVTTTRQNNASNSHSPPYWKKLLRYAAAVVPMILFGFVILYTLGAGWLAYRMDMPLHLAFAAGVAPFLPFALSKAFLAVIAGFRLSSRGPEFFKN